MLSSVISLNAMHTALLRHLSGDVTTSIAMNVRLYREEESTVGPLLDFSKAAKRDALSVVLPMFVRAVFIPLGTALCIAPMALQPSSERVGGVLTFQLMAGVSPLLFWAANLAFDLCVYALAWSLVGAMLNVQYDLSAEINAGALSVVLAFSVVGISTAYLVASFANSPTTAFTVTALFFFFGEYTNNATVGIKTLNPFSFHSAGVALEILVMATEGVLLFALVVWRDVRPAASGRLQPPIFRRSFFSLLWTSTRRTRRESRGASGGMHWPSRREWSREVHHVSHAGCCHEAL